MRFQGFNQKLSSMLSTFNYTEFVPQIVPQKMSGTITYKIRINNFVRSDSTSALFIQLYQDRKNRKIPLEISVPPKFFDKKKQRVRASYKYADDYNLFIEKKLADINTILIGYRLNNERVKLNDLVEDITTPSLKINFNTFFEKHLEYQKEKDIIKKSTYKQQKATLKKIKTFKDPLLFSEINETLFVEFRQWLKKTMKNAPATVEIATKNFKKYLHIANENGIKTELSYSSIKVKDVRGEITFLTPEEVKKLYAYYCEADIYPTWKNVLQRYLFSCFTGLRISDIEQLTEANFIDNILVFTAQKTGKLQRIKLNKTALSLIEMPHIFVSDYAQQTINEELKLIAKAKNIKKRLYFHSARHTFATNYLLAGGQVQNLQKLLGHSDISTTMKYVHVVDSLMNKEIGMLDDIVN